jgi:hypothetical protein
LAAVTALNWLALLHPVLMILFVYPVVGATIRLGILARERRLHLNPIAATVPKEHTDHGRWVTSGTVVAVLFALLWSFWHHQEPGVPFPGGLPRLLRLLSLGALALAACLALWRLRRPGRRAFAALLSWGALLGLGLEPEVWRLADHPFDPAFWQSHFWAGWLLCGLLLFAMAAAPEIARSERLRTLHRQAAFLIALLLAVQAISGCRDLLQLAPG